MRSRVQTKNRYKFTGLFDGASIVGKRNNLFNICVKHIKNKSKNEYLRNHTHILVSKAQYKKFANIPINAKIEFTASIYEYNKLNNESFVQRKQYGLKDINKLTIL